MKPYKKIFSESYDEDATIEVYSPKGTLMTLTKKGANIDVTMGEASKNLSPLKFIDLLQDAMKNSDFK